VAASYNSARVPAQGRGGLQRPGGEYPLNDLLDAFPLPDQLALDDRRLGVLCEKKIKKVHAMEEEPVVIVEAAEEEVGPVVSRTPGLEATKKVLLVCCHQESLGGHCSWGGSGRP
jgi:hypothetical protein